MKLHTDYTQRVVIDTTTMPWTPSPLPGVDRKPLDLMVTELLRLKGSSAAGGPAGFGIASQNDVPMAAKGIIVRSAFLGVEMKCACRCGTPSRCSCQASQPPRASSSRTSQSMFGWSSDRKSTRLNSSH